MPSAAQESVPLELPSYGATTLSLIDRVNRGLPIEAADKLSSAIAPDDSGFKYHLISKATYNRLRAKAPAGQAVMSREQGERVVRLARIWNFALRVWGDEAAARRFMLEPHMLLDDASPLDVTLSGELGGKLVEEVLGRLAYGSAA